MDTQVSYGASRRTADAEAVVDWFGVDLVIRATDTVVDAAVERFDPLMVDFKVLR